MHEHVDGGHVGTALAVHGGQAGGRELLHVEAAEDMALAWQEAERGGHAKDDALILDARQESLSRSVLATSGAQRAEGEKIGDSHLQVGPGPHDRMPKGENGWKVDRRTHR